jgi:hypothetical protein
MDIISTMQYMMEHFALEDSESSDTAHHQAIRQSREPSWHRMIKSSQKKYWPC